MKPLTYDEYEMECRLPVDVPQELFFFSEARVGARVVDKLAEALCQI